MNFQDRLQSIAEISNPSRNSPTPGKAVSDPACHSALDQLHPDVSSGAAEIYAASVALTEVLHPPYIVEEMGDSITPETTGGQNDYCGTPRNFG